MSQIQIEAMENPLSVPSTSASTSFALPGDTTANRGQQSAPSKAKVSAPQRPVTRKFKALADLEERAEFRRKRNKNLWGVIEPFDTRRMRLLMFEDIDSGRVTSLLELIEKYNAPLHKVKLWMEMRELYERDALEDKRLCTLRDINFFDVELQLINAFMEVYENGSKMTKQDLQLKAHRIARRIQMNEFTLRYYWLDSFMTRYFITTQPNTKWLHCNLVALKARRQNAQNAKTYKEFYRIKSERRAEKRAESAAITAPEAIFIPSESKDFLAEEEEDHQPLLQWSPSLIKPQPCHPKPCRFCNKDVNVLGGMKIKNFGFVRLSRWVTQNLGYVLTPVANESEFSDSICAKCISIFMLWIDCFEGSSKDMWDAAEFEFWAGLSSNKEVSTQTEILVPKEEPEEPVCVKSEVFSDADSIEDDPLAFMDKDASIDDRPYSPQAVKWELLSSTETLQPASEVSPGGEENDKAGEEMEEETVPIKLSSESTVSSDVNRAASGTIALEPSLMEIVGESVGTPIELTKSSKMTIMSLIDSSKRAKDSTDESPGLKPCKKIKLAAKGSKPLVVDTNLEEMILPLDSVPSDTSKAVKLRVVKILNIDSNKKFHCSQCRLYESLAGTTTVFKCPVCCKVLRKESQVYHHVQQNHPDKAFTCAKTWCFHITLDKTEMLEHESKCFHCENCERYEKMKRMPIKVYKCQLCCTFSLRELDYCAHITQKHPDRALRCLSFSNCRFVSPIEEELEAHIAKCPFLKIRMKKRGETVCHFCYESSSDWDANLKHNRDCQKVTVIEEKKFFRCETCGYACPSEADIREHQKLRHKELSFYLEVCSSCRIDFPTLEIGDHKCSK